MSSPTSLALASWGIPVVQSTIDRTAQFPTPAVNQRVQNLGTGVFERWDGAQWVHDVAGYPVLVGETGVVDMLYRYGDLRRYGAVLDGITDDHTALTNWVASCVAAGFTAVCPIKATALTSTTVVIGGALMIDAPKLTIKAKAGSGLTDVMSVTDIDDVDVALTIDCNSDAKEGLGGYANTRSPSRLKLRRLRVLNTATDVTYTYAGIRVISLGGIAGANKYTDVELIECRTENCGSVGTQLTYITDFRIVGGIRNDASRNHGLELVGCYNFQIDVVRGKNTGGSVLDIGDHSRDGVVVNVLADNGVGDAAVSIENTCVNVEVLGGKAINCRRPGFNVSYGSAGTAPNDTVRRNRVSNFTAVAIVPMAITGITKANPAVVTCPNHGFLSTPTSAYHVWFGSIVGMTQMNGLTGDVTVIDANTFSVNIDSSAFSTYTSGGVVGPYYPGFNAFATPATAQNCELENCSCDGFNGGAVWFDQSGGQVIGLTVTNLQGPSSYVFKGRGNTHGKVANIRCHDSTATDANGAFQFTGAPDDMEVESLYCLVCQTVGGTFTPLVRWEGTGRIDMHNCGTGGALNFLNATGASTVALKDCYGSVTSSPIQGTPTVLQQCGNANGVGDCVTLNGSHVFQQTGAPSAGLGSNGDFFFRTDTPGTANQRLYVKSAGAWVGIV